MGKERHKRQPPIHHSSVYRGLSYLLGGMLLPHSSPLREGGEGKSLWAMTAWGACLQSLREGKVQLPTSKVCLCHRDLELVT